MGLVDQSTYPVKCYYNTIKNMWPDSPLCIYYLLLHRLSVCHVPEQLFHSMHLYIPQDSNSLHIHGKKNSVKYYYLANCKYKHQLHTHNPGSTDIVQWCLKFGIHHFRCLCTLNFYCSSTQSTVAQGALGKRSFHASFYDISNKTSCISQQLDYSFLYVA